MNIPHEVIEAAAKIHYESFVDQKWSTVSPALQETYRERMRMVFDTAAPHIAAQSLRDAADYLDTNTGPNAIGIRKGAEALRLIAQLEENR